MELDLVLSRTYDTPWSTPTTFNLSLISSSSESEEWSTINFSPQFPNKKKDLIYLLVCSCYELFCFAYRESEFEDYEYVLWNPSTDTFQSIPHTDSRYVPCACLSETCVRDVFQYGDGFGFDAESHDYKFVRFMTNYRDFEDGCPYTSHHVAVYSYKNNSWKELPFPFRYDLKDEIYDLALCVNGFCYWRTCADMILSFDLSSDNFSTLPYPDLDSSTAGRIDLKVVFLIELDGSLGLVILFDQILFSFWVYQGSPSPSPWTRKIDLDVCLDANKKPLWLGKKNNNLVLLLQGSDGALLEYDYSRRELKKIDQIRDHHPSSMTISTVYPIPCVDTGRINNNAAENEDWISQLPDDIILTILSFLSLKEAASTSVLSTRWSDLWRLTPNLYFHDTHKLFFKSNRKHIGWENSVVKSHKTVSLKGSNISFTLNKPARRRTLTKWLGFAFSRRVEALELNLRRATFVFPEKFLQTRSMLKYLTNLTRLCLKCMKVSGEDIGLFLRNCPLLERLIIKHAALTSDLELCGGMLKHLDVQYCRGENLIKGYAPNLIYLRIHSGPKLWATNQSGDDTLRFISSQLTTLEYTIHHPKHFLKTGPRFPQIPTMRELILTYYGRGHDICSITSLICAFPYLEEFEIKNYTRSIRDNHSVTVVNNVERFCHRHLRVFKFTWFNVGDGDHTELMSCILDNCVALQKIILHNYAADSPSHVAYWKYVKQLQSKLPSHIELIIS